MSFAPRSSTEQRPRPLPTQSPRHSGSKSGSRVYYSSSARRSSTPLSARPTNERGSTGGDKTESATSLRLSAGVLRRSPARISHCLSRRHTTGDAARKLAGGSTQSTVSPTELFHYEYYYHPSASYRTQVSGDAQQQQQERASTGTPSRLHSALLENEAPFSPRGTVLSPFLLPGTPALVAPPSPRLGAGATRWQHPTSLAAGGFTGPDSGIQRVSSLIRDPENSESGRGAGQRGIPEVETLIERASAVLERKQAELAALGEEKEILAERVDACRARATRVKADLRVLMSSCRAREELEVLRDMAEERKERVATLRARRDAMQAMWEQLQLLHDQGEEPDSLAASEDTEVVRRARVMEDTQNEEVHEDEEEGLQRENEDVEEITVSLDDSEWGEDTDTSAMHQCRCEQARQPSVAPAGTRRSVSVLSDDSRETLHRFLDALMVEAEDLALICIQVPSAPAASCISRTRAARNLNEGNNGFFSYFGGATESHLSAKPLSTFLTCASRLQQSAWLHEEALQLHACELADEKEDERLRKRLEGQQQRQRRSQSSKRQRHGRPATTSPPPACAGSASKDTAITPEESSVCKALFSTDEGVSPIAQPNGRPSAQRPSAWAAPVLLPSTHYAHPRLSQVSRQLDQEQRRVQGEYASALETQRQRRRALVARMRTAYKKHCATALTEQLRALQTQQTELVEQLAGMGVAEVSLEWEEAEAEEEDEQKKRVDLAVVSANRNGLVSPRRTQSQVWTSAPTKYLRQVIIRTQSAAGLPSHDKENLGRCSTATVTEGRNGSGQQRLTVVHTRRISSHSTEQDRSRSTVDAAATTSTSATSTRTTVAPTTGRSSRDRMEARPLVEASPLKSVSPMKLAVAASAATGGAAPVISPRGKRRPMPCAPSAASVSSGAVSPRSSRSGPASPRVEHHTTRLSAGPATATAASLLLGLHPGDSPAAMLDSGAVRVELTFCGAEGRRRRDAERAQEQHRREFWQLREELARVDEEVFITRGRLAELETTYAAQAEVHVRKVREAEGKVISCRDFLAVLQKERQEWEEIKLELQALTSPPPVTSPSSHARWSSRRDDPEGRGR